MRHVQELRQTLDDHADLAPDGTGLVAAAQAGAVKLRRRRRMAYTAAVAAVAAVVVTIPATISGVVNDGPRHSAGQPTYRKPFQLTVDLAQNSDGYFKLSTGTDSTRQFMSMRTLKSSIRDPGGEVRVHDPGTFDATPLLRGEPVTVQGHRAYYVPDLDVGTILTLPGGDKARDKEHGRQTEPEEKTVRTPAVGWPDGSGAWVVVYTTVKADRATLLRLAELVRLGPPRDVLAPYHLTYVPGGLPGRFASSNDRIQGTMPGSSIVLDAGGQPSRSPFGNLPPRDAALGIQVSSAGNRYDDAEWADILRQLGRPTHTIAGHPVWYVTQPHPVLTGPRTGSNLLFATGPCHVFINVADRERIPFEELKRMVEGARFSDCRNPRTWTPPLP